MLSDSLGRNPVPIRSKPEDTLGWDMFDNSEMEAIGIWVEWLLGIPRLSNTDFG
jgi:hypothetical protein